MKTTDPDDIFRLYIREWVIVHTLDAKALDDTSAARLHSDAVAWVEQNLADRVHDKDVRLTMHTDVIDAIWCDVEVFKDNLKGEFSQLGLAQTHALVRHYEEYTIVTRNSAADHEIRNYGVKKL